MTLFSTRTQRLEASTLAALLVGFLLVTTGCDSTVNVLRPSDEYRFSLFGVLNVATDTQVVRVEPIGDSTQIGAPPELDATVVLENLGTGQQLSLRDSFTTVGEGVRVHNFWTTHPIQPATTYRIVVQSQGKAVTRATTTTPAHSPDLSHNDAFLLPCLFPRSPSEERKAPNTFIVEVRNVEGIAAADIIYPITYRIGQRSLRTRNTFTHYRTVEDKGSFFEVPIFYRPDLVELNPDPALKCVSREDFTHPYAIVAVTAGGPNWPKEWRGLPLDHIARTDSFSNVRGGHGFIGGVYSDTITVPVRQRPPPTRSDLGAPKANLNPGKGRMR